MTLFTHIVNGMRLTNKTTYMSLRYNFDMEDTPLDGQIRKSKFAFCKNYVCSSVIIICYKYNKPIRNTIFNFNKLVSDLDIHANTPKS